MRGLSKVLIGSAIVAAVPVRLLAPKPGAADESSVPNLGMALLMCQNSGRGEWELVDFATSLVHSQYRDHSAWHLWETPRQSFERRRGQSSQYNRALARLLQALGFEVQIVHAARVRGRGSNPWFHTGHVWLRVRHHDLIRDVCAGDAANRAGSVHFVPTSEVRPAKSLTPTFVASALAPFVAADVWTQLLRRRPPSRWLYRPFNEQP